MADSRPAPPADEETSPLLVNSHPDPSSSSSPASLSSRFTTLLHSPSHLNGLEKLLAAGSIFLLLLTATGFGLFAGEAVKLKGEHHKHGDGHKTVTVTHSQLGTVTSTVQVGRPTGAPTPPGKNSEVCTTSTCVTVAATVISAMDQSIDPCEDFYLFANGGWLDSHPIPSGQGFFGSAQDIGERNKRTILQILDTPLPPSTSSTMDPSDRLNLHHLQSFYNSCLDEDSLDRTGLEPLLDLIEIVVDNWRGVVVPTVAEVMGEEMGGMQVQKEKRQKALAKKGRKERLTDSLMLLHSREIATFFVTYPEGDVAEDPTTLLLWLKQAALGLPSADYYDDKETVEVYTEIVRASLKSIYEAREEPEKVTGVAEVAKEVVDLERELGEIGLDNEHLEDPKATYNKVNATSLATLFPLISFSNYFASFTPRPSYPDPVIVTSPSYFKNLTTIIEGLDEDTVEAYFLWKTILAYAPMLGPKETVRKEVEWLNNYLGGVEEGVRPARGDVCLASLLENFGFLIGRYYVQKAFTGDSKEYAEDIIVATIQAFKDRLPELDWLDAKTRAAAEEKANAITHKIGYPTNPNTTDAAAIARYYSINLPISSKDYFGNVLRAKLADQRRTWVQVGHKMDKGMWDMIPSEVNAYYSPPANEIAFPAGILQAPYFSKDWPEYMAFGAFGSVAGHELTHAFDQMGRQYNKDGKLTDWWTKATVARFQELKGCLLEQYANYTVLDANGKEYHINSNFTNGEDMADGGGIAQSYRAWVDRFDSDKKGDTYKNYLLPGLDLSREQLFYVAYAQGWARNIKPAEAVKRIRTDPHSPTKYRVIGPLSNDKDFSKAFGCKAGQPMSNVDKCSIW